MTATQKWVNLGLLAASAALFLFLSKLTGTLWDAFRLPLPESWPIEPFYVVSFVLAAAAGFLARQNEKANIFLNEVAFELARVTWPNRKETMTSAGVVIVLVGLASLIMLVMDALWGATIRGVLRI